MACAFIPMLSTDNSCNKTAFAIGISVVREQRTLEREVVFIGKDGFSLRLHKSIRRIGTHDTIVVQIALRLEILDRRFSDGAKIAIDNNVTDIIGTIANSLQIGLKCLDAFAHRRAGGFSPISRSASENLLPSCGIHARATAAAAVPSCTATGAAIRLSYNGEIVRRSPACAFTAGNTEPTIDGINIKEPQSGILRRRKQDSGGGGRSLSDIERAARCRNSAGTSIAGDCNEFSHHVAIVATIGGSEPSMLTRNCFYNDAGTVGIWMGLDELVLQVERRFSPPSMTLPLKLAINIPLFILILAMVAGQLSFCWL